MECDVLPLKLWARTDTITKNPLFWKGFFGQLSGLTGNLSFLVSSALLAGSAILLKLELLHDELLVLAAIIIGAFAGIAFEAQ